MDGQILNGIIVRGLGEGTHFMSMPHYKKEIKKKLGFDAYPGTLNLRISKEHADLLRDMASIRIEGYKSANKIFGGVNCYQAKVINIKGSIIIPDLTKHDKEIIEFIAPVHLKSELKLKDGDEIRIELLK